MCKEEILLAWEITKNPGKLKELKKKEPLGFLAKLAWIFPLGIAVLTLAGVKAFALDVGGIGRRGSLGILAMLVLGYPAVILSAVMGAAFYHIFLWLLGARSNFKNTLRAVVFGSSPSLLFGWIPWLNTLIGLYSGFYLTPKAASIYHNTSYGKALVALLLPLVMALALALVIITFAFIGMG